MKIDNVEVRSCPYCGSEDLKVYHLLGYWVGCRGCLSQGPETDNAVEAVIKWNSVYPAMDADFANVWVKALAKERNKKIYDSNDIEWILEKVKVMKVDVNYILDNLAILLRGRENED